ncbi:MAG: tagaturonate epimerase family protein [Anaerolineae bacterium]
MSEIRLAVEIEGLTVYQDSVVDKDDVSYFLALTDEGEKLLGVKGDDSEFKGELQDDVLLCPLTPENGAVLRARLAWLRPVCLGLRTSFGFGDRLGLATPGHVRAGQGFREISPIFAQQSVRENARTGRTPQEVLDDAMWGVFQAGWRGAWGADADHLKTPDDVAPFVIAGYTFYTIDPGDHVDDEAHTAPDAALASKIHALPWEALEINRMDLEQRYLDRSFDLGDFTVALDRETLYRAAAKYGCAIAHTTRMYHTLVEQMGDKAFELEVSVDETETPTSPEEHIFIASELERLGVEWVSLAPRYIGRFEKGVDYMGDLSEFRTELDKHASIARAFGPYKLSVHSGSDKFSIYPSIAEATDGLAHVKTAGTSYLEALRTVGQVDREFFREILTLARERYEADRVTYHVSAELSRVPDPHSVNDDDLPDLLEQFDARQALHVTFGSVLDRFGDRLRSTLEAHEEVYAELLDRHFRRHLSSLVEGSE